MNIVGKLTQSAGAQRHKRAYARLSNSKTEDDARSRQKGFTLSQKCWLGRVSIILPLIRPAGYLNSNPQFPGLSKYSKWTDGDDVLSKLGHSGPHHYVFVDLFYRFPSRILQVWGFAKKKVTLRKVQNRKLVCPSLFVLSYQNNTAL